jgi:hypothetical protein
MAAGSERVGVMVVRIWTEDPLGSIRARITRTLDLTTNDETSCVAASTEEVLERVREWVEEFAAQARPTM